MTEAALIGATGLVGRAVAAQTTRPLTALMRRDDGAWPPLVSALVAAPDAWPQFITTRAPRVLINCLGTTIKLAGSEAAFRAVDHDLVLAAAGAARAAGARHCITVSSVGASARSRNFYLRTKGEMEDGLRALGFERLDIIRPGLLLGQRQGPKRAGESFAMRLSPLTDALMRGGLRRYRSVHADTVAGAILMLAARGGSGVHVHEHDAILALAD